MKKMLILNRLWLGKTDVRLIFQPSSIQSRQFQTLASLTIMSPQHIEPVNQNQLSTLASKK